MGAVYECIHLTTRKRRALKVMLPQVVASAETRDRFELEARVTAEIESDHIVETFDAGVYEATGAPFLVMELLRGDDLDGVYPRGAQMRLLMDALAVGESRVFGVEALAADPLSTHLVGGVVPSIDTHKALRDLESMVARHGLVRVPKLQGPFVHLDIDLLMRATQGGRRRQSGGRRCRTQ